MSKICKGYAKVIILLLAFSITLVTAQNSARARYTTSASTSYYLEGYSREWSIWTRGLLSGWLEENWVPYRLRIASIVPGYFKIIIQHDHQWTGLGGPDLGVDQCKSKPGNPLLGAPSFLTEPTEKNFWIGDALGTDTGINVITERISDLYKPNNIVIQYRSTFTILDKYKDKTLYLYWMSHLATGSSEWSGASLHALTTETGSQDVPIAVPPKNKLFGYKFYDANHNAKMDPGESGIAGWTIYLEGTYLGSTIKLEKKTDSTGYYEFSALPVGTWTLTEEHKSKWIEATSSPFTVFTLCGKTRGPYNFGNFEVVTIIDVTKIGSLDKAHEDDTITYKITVKNTGTTKLFNVTVTDTLLGLIYEDALDPGQEKTFSETYKIPQGAPDPLDNTVTANGTDEFGLTVNATASWKVEILHPKIDIEKTATPDTIKLGENVTYKYNITNIGDCTLYNIDVTDDKLGVIGTIPRLDPRESQTLTSYAQPLQDTTNNGTAIGKDELGKEVSDSDTAFVHVISTIPPPQNPPSFSFKCISSVEQAQVGKTKTLTIVASNTGVPQSRIYYLTFTAVIGNYSLLKFEGPPYTAHIKIYYNDGSTWEADVSGVLTEEKFSVFEVLGDYWMVTWRVPTTYPAKPYLEGNYFGYLNAKAEISFQVTGVAQGSTWLAFFPRATEDHHAAGVPLGSVADKANIWESRGYWYPVHNSYDPYDIDIGTGHVFQSLTWTALPATSKYARAIRFIDVVS